MAPTLRSAHEPMSPTKGTKAVSRRTHRAKSLPFQLNSSSAGKAPQKLTSFDLGPILPSNVVICKACRGPIIKTPSPPATPKFSNSPRSHLEKVLQKSLKQAHSRAVSIQAAYANAFRDYDHHEYEDKDKDYVIGNPDEEFDHTAKDKDNKYVFAVGTQPIKDHWRNAPYTAEVHKTVGKLYADLGRAMATNQKCVKLLNVLLDEERDYLKSDDREAQDAARKVWENAWFEEQRVERWKARQPKKRKRN